MYKFLFCKIFNIKLNKIDQIISNHIFEKSFRFGKKDATKKTLVLRYFFNLLKRPLVKLEDIETRNLVLDIGEQSERIRLSYLEYYDNGSPYKFLSLDDFIGFHSKRKKLLFVIFNLPLLCICFLISLFYKDKSSFALILQHKIVCSNLLLALKGSKTCNVFMFSIYDNASNYIANGLMNSGFQVIKIPSEVPISIWNSNILTNILIICNAYQLEEIEHNQDTIQLDTTKIWGPEHSHKYLNLYQKRDTITAKNRIGFYSTAGWVRSKEDHMDQGVDMVSNEKKVLKLIQNIVEENKELELIIFLHPREKKLIASEVDNYYCKLFGNNNFTINDKDQVSAESFDRVSVAVAFHTTLMYERLFMGFKSILYPLGMYEFGFPIKDSSIANICAHSEAELKSKIINAMKQTDEEFFKCNKLTHYIKPQA